ncbi:MAG: type I pullulanase [Clostridiales bacterium]
MVKIKKLKPGVYRYSDVCDFLSDDKKINLKENSCEDYSYIISGYKILSSRDIVSFRTKTQLLLINYLSEKYEFISSVKWNFEPKIKGVKIDKYGNLTVDDSLVIDSDCDIFVYTKINGEKIGKTIRIVINDIMNKYQYLVHYYRHNEDYTGWNIWSWCDECNGDKSEQIDFFEENDFGRLAGLNMASFKLRKYDWVESLHKMAFSNTLSTEIYATDWDWNVYTNFLDAYKAISPKIKFAIMDNDKEIIAYLSSFILYNTEFYLTCNGKEISNISYKIEERKIIFKLPCDFKLDTSMYYEIHASNFFSPCKVTLRDVLDKFCYDGDDLGITFNKTKVILKVWAPTAYKVKLYVYKDYNVKDGYGSSYKMKRIKEKGIWVIELNKYDIVNKYYNLNIIINPGTKDELDNFVVDPYAKAISVNGIKGFITDINNIEDELIVPSNFFEHKRPVFESHTDAVIYEMNVRDYTCDPNSGVKNKGKFLGITEEGTRLNGDSNIKTGLDHLLELGVNCVQLMPIFDYKTVNEGKCDPDDYNWGYDPQNFNVPEGIYSTNPFNPKSRILESREMIQKLHEKDIYVVMDVVYNHTYELSTFDSLVPGYYYRSNEYLRYSDGSGCGSELATERFMVRKFILDSLIHWYENYRIDGFRFDLMGLYDKKTMEIFVKKLQEYNSNILIYGEPWKGGWSTLPWHESIFKGTQRSKGYGVFSDNYRNALRGDNGVPKPSLGYLTNDYSKKEEVFNGVMGAINDFTDHPTEVVNYISCHDNYLLYDQISSHYFNFEKPYKSFDRRIEKDNPLENEIVKRTILGSGIILTSQGIAFIHSGDEFLRTKFGNHNSYNSSENINMVNWKYKKYYKKVFDFYSQMIKLRLTHKLFRLDTKELVNIHFQGLYAPDLVVAYTLKNNNKYDEWKNIIVIYNPYNENKLVYVPKGKWLIYVNSNYINNSCSENEPQIINKIEVDSISITILYEI